MKTLREEFEDIYNKITNNNRGVAYHVDITGKYCFQDIEDAWQLFQIVNPRKRDVTPEDRTNFEKAYKKPKYSQWDESDSKYVAYNSSYDSLIDAYYYNQIYKAWLMTQLSS